ncbi:50S ribosome-binding GTPase [Candidatus Bathyarchaeota archaeon]|nr:50S ribosome-binding GTPase [Candidatus Bathyarchaeota archaeon]
MPTNLPAEAKAKWDEVTLTKNPEERLRLMGEFLSLVPKHKGTERMCSQVKRQMAQLRDEIDKKKKQAKTGGGLSPFIQKAGAAQVAVIGPTNVGRSSLLRAVTNAQVEVTPYPFGTKQPVPGMLPYEDIQFQLVEIPPIVDGSSEGRADGFQNLSAVRNADGIIMVVDLTDDPAGNLLMVQGELDASRILTSKPEGEVNIQRRGVGRDIQFVWEGEFAGCTREEVVALLNEFRIRSALVRIRGSVTIDNVEDAIFGNAVYRPTLVLANKADLGIDQRTVDQLRMAADPLEVLVISAEKTPNLATTIGNKLFKFLEIARIYTKEPGEEPAREPVVVRRGITVGELARTIHNDFYKNFKYARIWGPSAKFPNEKVGLDRVLEDGTIIRLYM